MAFFSKKEVVLSSPFEATITFQGKPAEGAVVKRHVRWKDDEGVSDTGIVDEQGRVSLPPVHDNWRQMLPAEFVAHQRITVEYQGEETLIWVMGKMDEEMYGELGFQPDSLFCELTDELDRVEVSNGLLGTLCKWKS